MSNPKSLTARELDLLSRYCQCEFGMTPQAFYAKWSVTYEQIAEICVRAASPEENRSASTVRRWFARGQRYRRPTPNDLRHYKIRDRPEQLSYSLSTILKQSPKTSFAPQHLYSLIFPIL
ncbi:MAG: helix-turn-helix domain-containing protein [Cyanobacteria bacterium SBLK]|nr:helix-turn-helix domain-containing protein [Cyanobacteria bacterium SBLK]